MYGFSLWFSSLLVCPALISRTSQKMYDVKYFKIEIVRVFFSKVALYRQNDMMWILKRMITPQLAENTRKTNIFRFENKKGNISVRIYDVTIPCQHPIFLPLWSYNLPSSLVPRFLSLALEFQQTPWWNFSYYGHRSQGSACLHVWDSVHWWAVAQVIRSSTKHKHKWPTTNLRLKCTSWGAAELEGSVVL